jgi:UDP-glucuronate decarboxylase
MREINTIIDDDLNKIVSADLPWNKLFGKTILITGANGFLPAYMVKTLLRLNDQINARITVLALVRNRQKAEDRFTNYTKRPDFRLLVENISEPLNITADIDFVVHAASQASPKFYATDPVGTLAANTIGTYNLLQLAVQKKVQNFLYFSSSEVYGSVADGSSIDENSYGTVDPLNIRSCYAESKRMGETMCISFSAQYKIPVSIVRPFHTYGPGLSLDDGRVFADFVANIVKGTNIVMNSDGSAVRSFCYLADAVEGFFSVLLKGENQEAYNIGNPDASLSIKELAELLVNMYPEKKLSAVFQQGNQNYLQSTYNKLCPNILKANALGWQPTTNAVEGFKRTIESFVK